MIDWEFVYAAWGFVGTILVVGSPVFVPLAIVVIASAVMAWRSGA